MSYAERLELYRRIEAIRGRPLIAYVTSLRTNASGSMAGDAIPQIAKQILNIPKDQKEVDIFIVSNGGDPVVSWRVISMLRERFERIGVLIPYTAYSAATLLAICRIERGAVASEFSRLECGRHTHGDAGSSWAHHERGCPGRDRAPASSLESLTAGGS